MGDPPPDISLMARDLIYQKLQDRLRSSQNLRSRSSATKLKVSSKKISKEEASRASLGSCKSLPSGPDEISVDQFSEEFEPKGAMCDSQEDLIEELLSSFDEGTIHGMDLDLPVVCDALRIFDSVGTQLEDRDVSFENCSAEEIVSGAEITKDMYDIFRDKWLEEKIDEECKDRCGKVKTKEMDVRAAWMDCYGTFVEKWTSDEVEDESREVLKDGYAMAERTGSKDSAKMFNGGSLSQEGSRITEEEAQREESKTVPKIKLRPTPVDLPPLIQEYNYTLSSHHSPCTFHIPDRSPEISLCHLAMLLHSLLESDNVNLYIYSPNTCVLEESLMFRVLTRERRSYDMLGDYWVAQAARKRRVVVRYQSEPSNEYPEGITSILCCPITASQLQLHGVIELGRSHSKSEWSVEHMNSVYVLTTMYALDRQATAGKKPLHCESHVHEYMKRIVDEYFQGAGLERTIEKCLNFVKHLTSSEQANLVQILFKKWQLFYRHTTSDENHYVRSETSRREEKKDDNDEDEITETNSSTETVSKVRSSSLESLTKNIKEDIISQIETREEDESKLKEDILKLVLENISRKGSKTDLKDPPEVPDLANNPTNNTEVPTIFPENSTNVAEVFFSTPASLPHFLGNSCLSDDNDWNSDETQREDEDTFDPSDDDLFFEKYSESLSDGESSSEHLSNENSSSVILSDEESCDNVQSHHDNHDTVIPKGSKYKDIIDYICDKEQAVMLNDERVLYGAKKFLEPLSEHQTAESLNIKRVLSVPIRSQGGVFGILSAFNTAPFYTTQDKHLLEIITTYLSLVLSHYEKRVEASRLKLNYENVYGLLRVCPTREMLICEHEYKERLGNWNLEVLPLEFFTYEWYPETSQLQNLHCYCFQMFEMTCALLEIFQHENLVYFIRLVQLFYHDNSYHNFLLGVLSMHFVFLTIWECKRTCGLDKISLLIASLCQYIGHTGTDVEGSVLTEHHLTLTLRLIDKSMLLPHKHYLHVEDHVKKLMSSTDTLARTTLLTECVETLTTIGINYKNARHRILTQKILLNTSRLVYLCKPSPCCTKDLMLKHFSIQRKYCACSFDEAFRNYLDEEHAGLQFQLLALCMPWKIDLREMARLKTVLDVLC